MQPNLHWVMRLLTQQRRKRCGAMTWTRREHLSLCAASQGRSRRVTCRVATVATSLAPSMAYPSSKSTCTAPLGSDLTDMPQHEAASSLLTQSELQLSLAAFRGA